MRVLGSREPDPPDFLESRYGNADAYMDEFTDSLDATIEAGFLLESDRSDILDEAAEKAEALLPAGS